MTNSSHKKPLAVIALSLTSLLAACDLFKSSDDHLARAEAALGKGDYDAAMVDLKNALADEPKNARARLLVARASLSLGNLDASLKALGEAEADGADPVEVSSLRAQLLLRMGRFDELRALLDSRFPPREAATLRPQLLAATNHCAQAVPQARRVLTTEPANAALRLVVAECYGRYKNHVRALAELQSGVSANPSSAETWMALGFFQKVSGQAVEAEKSLGKALRLAAGQLSVPQQVVLLSTRADLQVARNDPEALRATHRELLNLLPQSPFTELVGAQSGLLEGNHEKSIASLRKLAVSAPKLAATHALLASAYLAQGNHEQARQELAWLGQNAPQGPSDKAATLTLDSLAKAPSGSGEYWMALGELQGNLGQIEQARSALNKAVEVAPQSLPAAVALIRLELRAADFQRAARLAEDLARKYPDDGQLASLRAEALVGEGKYPDADALLAQQSTRKPSAALTVQHYRVRAAGKLANAMAPLEQWLSRHPDDQAVRALFAEALRAAGETPRSIAEYEKLTAAVRPNPAVLNNLAWLYQQQNDARALATAKRAWELSPKRPEVADTYGWLLVQNGAVAQGAQVLADADAVAGVIEPEIRFHFVQALARLGERERASALLRELVAENPASPGEAEMTTLLASIEQSGTT